MSLSVTAPNDMNPIKQENETQPLFTNDSSSELNQITPINNAPTRSISSNHSEMKSTLTNNISKLNQPMQISSNESRTTNLENLELNDNEGYCIAGFCGTIVFIFIGTLLLVDRSNTDHNEEKREILLIAGIIAFAVAFCCGLFSAKNMDVD